MKYIIKKKLFGLVIVLTVLLLFQSCYKKDFFDKATVSEEFQPVYVFPLGYLQFVLKDFMDFN